VSSYSWLELANRTDVLRAIEGLAQALHKTHKGGIFSEEYQNGLWIHDRYRGLLWRPDHSFKNSESVPVANMPSYTWASHNGRVTFPIGADETAVATYARPQQSPTHAFN
jgi:hypothetical protein